MGRTDFAHHIESVRRFNRFYTQQIGVLNDGLLKSPFSLTEGRVIYELAHHEKTTATELGNELGLDAGYLSRILRGFIKSGLVDKQPSETDGRQSVLWLTEQGQSEFALLNARSHHEIDAMLNRLSTADQNRLTEAMHTIEGLLGARPEHKVPYLLRSHQPGDMGWVVHRHGVLYAEEYGWDEQFEALVAGIVSEFIQHYDPKRERCWIAEREGENVGSVFLVKKSETTAKLRLLLVDPKARGLGIGKRLVDECIRFARQAGYREMTLWTNSVLVAARHIYTEAGFRLVQSEPHHSFGHDLISETWELTL
ncbi:MAG TPA: helix-turn-helix domain-containing GNAT family N-acetyltransferase [Symbiobacteriaceae bacterium]|jgi:DNA-binding MarR family transcriptional regulator/GNAT superfamily N-acetyltransferase